MANEIQCVRERFLLWTILRRTSGILRSDAFQTEALVFGLYFLLRRSRNWIPDYVRSIQTDGRVIQRFVGRKGSSDEIPLVFANRSKGIRWSGPVFGWVYRLSKWNDVETRISQKKWMNSNWIMNTKNAMNKVSEAKSYLLKSLEMTNGILRKIDAKEMSIDINEF